MNGVASGFLMAGRRRHIFATWVGEMGEDVEIGLAARVGRFRWGAWGAWGVGGFRGLLVF